MKITNYRYENIKLNKIGGLNNSNYLFEVKTKKYVLRIPSKDNKNNFKNEGKILNLISPLHITPKIKYHNDKGILISQYKTSIKVSLELYNSKTFISDLVVSLKKLHKTDCKITFDPFNEIYNNICELNSIGYQFQHNLESVLNKLKVIENFYNDKKVIGLCHNDLNTSNILYSNKNIYFVDFEFAGTGDIFFDLATLSWFLSEEMKIELLNNYFGRYDYDLKKKLEDYIFVVKLWNATWSFIKSSNNNGNYDYKLGGNMILDDLINNYL